MRIHEVQVGMTAEEKIIITDGLIRSFANISNDFNPLHLDEEYAKKSRYKKRIAHGLLSGSLFSGIFGTKIPGEGCVYVSQNFQFLKPVYIGDEVKAVVEVKSIDLTSRRILFKTKCFVGKREVINGIAEIFVPEK